MPGGVVTANAIHGNKLLGCETKVLATGTNWVSYRGPAAPVNAIWCIDGTTQVAEAPAIDFNNPGTGANAGSMKVTVSAAYDGLTIRITWLYGGG